MCSIKKGFDCFKGFAAAQKVKGWQKTMLEKERFASLQTALLKFFYIFKLLNRVFLLFYKYIVKEEVTWS